MQHVLKLESNVLTGNNAKTLARKKLYCTTLTNLFARKSNEVINRKYFFNRLGICSINIEVIIESQFNLQSGVV